MNVLQALVAHYHRLRAAPEPVVPEYGYTIQPVHWLVRIDDDGSVRTFEDLRRQPLGASAAFPLSLEVPEHPHRGGPRPKPFFLSDNARYVFGAVPRADGTPVPDTGERTRAFRDYHRRIIGSHPATPALAAFLLFLDQPFPHDLPAAAVAANFVFAHRDDNTMLHQLPEARALWRTEHEHDPKAPRGRCMATGQEGPIARLHPVIRRVRGAQSTGTLLVSFNQPAFQSAAPHRTQGHTAPVTKRAAAAYGAALNSLLANPRHSIAIGHTTIVHWAHATDNAPAAAAAENAIHDILNPPSPNDPEASQRLGTLLVDAAAGRPLRSAHAALDPRTTYHVLGLVPNAGRLAVRFYHRDPLHTLLGHLAAHHADLAFDPPGWDHPPSIGRLLAEILSPGQNSPPPALAAAMARAVLANTPYPAQLMPHLLARVRTDRTVTRARAALLRAVLARGHRHGLITKEPPPMSIDDDHADVPYRLGRLFALYESVQFYALRGTPNSALRDRHFAGACTRPAATFATLARLSTGHLRRLRNDAPGLAAFFERTIDELFAGLPRAIPALFNAEQQARFTIGYHHERHRPRKPAEDTERTNHEPRPEDHDR